MPLGLLWSLLASRVRHNVRRNCWMMLASVLYALSPWPPPVAPCVYVRRFKLVCVYNIFPHESLYIFPVGFMPVSFEGWIATKGEEVWGAHRHLSLAAQKSSPALNSQRLVWSLSKRSSVHSMHGESHDPSGDPKQGI